MSNPSENPRDQAEIERLTRLLEQQRDAALQGKDPVIDDQKTNSEKE